ncbi:MAG: DNA polymerase III [Spirochaetaceae bacterium]|nr:DNA polymerase III [Spirochaetaceae bacterium]
MFENMIGQPVTARLQADMAHNVLAPAMLFAGPHASGKGTAALEMGRAFSCETENAPWNCRCVNCMHHRLLSHDDLIVMGPRPFSAEIAAARAAFLRDTASASSKTLFVRSVRKLLMRFSPVLWTDDSKISKLNGILESINETMEELDLLCSAEGNAEKITKICDSVIKHTLKLEAEGMTDTIPVSHIRSAAYWLRIAPSGKRKLLVIENADRMQDAARNSLLKILEEPPGTCAIIFCSSKPEALLETIVSRLRPYIFARRGEEADTEVVRRVFKDSKDAIPAHSKAESGITAYLDTFLPVPKHVLYPVSALFWASIAFGITMALRKKGVPDAELPPAVMAIGRHCAPIAEAAGLGKASPNIKSLCAAVLAAAGGFDSRGAFTVFLGMLCSTLSEALIPIQTDPVCAAYRRVLSKYAGKARTAVDTFNQTSSLALENLSSFLIHDLAILW